MCATHAGTAETNTSTETLLFTIISISSRNSFSLTLSLTVKTQARNPCKFLGWNDPHSILTFVLFILIQDEKFMDQMRMITS